VETGLGVEGKSTDAVRTSLRLQKANAGSGSKVRGEVRDLELG